MAKAYVTTQNGFVSDKAVAASLLSLGAQKSSVTGVGLGLGSMAGSSAGIPLHKVYEMRGTMLHEMQGITLTIICRRFSCRQMFY